jgi:hypothetical protein
MKGITKQDKVEFIEKVAKALSKTDARIECQMGSTT